MLVGEVEFHIILAKAHNSFCIIVFCDKVLCQQILPELVEFSLFSTTTLSPELNN
jgi:hypothetical protein